MKGVLAVLVSTMALACCAQPDPPLLSLTNRTCDATPVMDGALPVALGGTGSTSVKIGAASPCLQSSGGPATYAVFRLPDAAGPYMATVSSELVGNALIPPRATVLDEAGRATRVIPVDEFRADLSGYKTGLRLGAGDRFIVVAADPAHLGQRMTLRVSAREVGVQVAAVVPIIIVVPNNIPAQVTELPATLSLNGMLRVSASAISRVP